MNSFYLPDSDYVQDVIDLNCYGSGIKKVNFNNSYPLHVFAKTQLPIIEFAEITIFYGSNGSGKSTLLNVIGEKLGVQRQAPFSTSTHFKDYVSECFYTLEGADDGSAGQLPPTCRVIASDDIFNYLLTMRQENKLIQEKRDEVLNVPRPREKQDALEPWSLTSLKDYPRFKKFHEFRKWTRSRLLQKYAGDLNPERSNAQTALQYFKDVIDDDGLYLLDEPENSLSPRFQMELVDFLQEAARFFRCQFIIATHSPFVLSLRGARIYDLDATHDHVKPWTELENVRLYYEFFQKNRNAFSRKTGN